MSESPDWQETNRRMWDERVPIHVGSSFYDVAGFKAGKPALEPFEVEELGPLGSLRLAHLQCHFGMDTLDLVRLHPTLEAVGVDFSTPAVEAAGRLAEEVGLSDRVSFVQSGVYEALETLEANSFDVVYTGKGALNWLPDMPRWAEVCAGLLRPAGWLYVCEFHPISRSLGFDQIAVEHDYFHTGAEVYERQGTYADPSAQMANDTMYEWNHPLPQVIDAVIGAGFDLRFFHEWDYTLSEEHRWLVRGPDRRYRWPGRPRLPLMYSLKAQKR